MNTGLLYRAAIEAEARITAKMNRLRYARADVAQRGMAFDSNADDAREVYISALAQKGIARDELLTLTSYDLERMLRCIPTRGSRSSRAGMAYDHKQTSKLDGILGGVATPMDLTER
jgi:hypothetical protein